MSFLEVTIICLSVLLMTSAAVLKEDAVYESSSKRPLTTFKRLIVDTRYLALLGTVYNQTLSLPKTLILRLIKNQRQTFAGLNSIRKTRPAEEAVMMLFYAASFDVCRRTISSAQSGSHF